MSVKSYQYTFGAGDKKQYRGGGFFTIEQLTDEVTVELFSPRGNSIGKLENIGAGFWIRIPESGGGFGYVEVTSATAQTVNVIAGDGEFGVNKTSTSITGGTLDPQTLSSQYFRSSALAAVTQIIAPASNINGVRIDSCGIGANGNTTAQALAANTSAPIAWATSSNMQILVKATGAYNKIQSIGLPVIIPAGYGLYDISSSAVDTSFCTVNYEIL